MEAKRSATIFHAKSLLIELSKKVNFIKGQEKDLRMKALKIYTDMKDDVKLLIKKFLEEGGDDTELKSIVRDIKAFWAELEKMVYGPVVIVTKNVSFLKSQKRLWENVRNIEIAEDPEEAIRIAEIQKPLSGAPVSNFIVDSSCYSDEELEAFGEEVARRYKNQVHVLIVGK